MENKKIMVERETYEKNGKQYFTYFVKGNVRGQDVRAGVVPPDFGGYKVLDIVYNGAKEAELEVTPFKIKSDDGSVIFGNTYAVISVDEETGEIYSCKIKPSRESDKSLLSMLLSRM